MDLSRLAFDADGLVPVVAQDVDTGQVLMLAYASAAAIEASLETGYAHYHSRSRGQLWEKGATSGHRQELYDVRIDCDGDAVLYLVEQAVGACHTGHRSCFYRTLEGTDVGAIVFDPDEVYD
jgi:phosphoribosyl-AMP cyclohydrolase (EC 3.5.4.19)